ncbi:hypothetical protein GXB85_01270 [Cellulomonas sp. APG4]|uniref:hypothetical protein n=1 Tax=Cellulomonas sp. APG4 TaxID=1538656 RepID=UPI00137A98C5|nr:hypothetical protein [Cellulomonas sp. APG4]NCT89588.1 hypothetical protein [Cellulomonas sp. APG4]
MSNPYAPPPPGRTGTQERPGSGRDGGRTSSAPHGAGTGAPHGEPAPDGAERPDGRRHPAPVEGGPGPRGPGPQPRPPVDPEAARAASRRVLHFGLLMLATLLTSTLPLPWQVATLVFAVLAFVVGVRALVQVWRSGLRGALVSVLAVGLAFAALLAASTAGLIALWPVQMERQECLQDALTISATEKCESDYRDALDALLERARGGLAPAGG